MSFSLKRAQLGESGQVKYVEDELGVVIGSVS